MESFGREVGIATEHAFAAATDPQSVDLVIAELPIRLRATDPGLLKAFSDALMQHEVSGSDGSRPGPAIEIKIWSSRATGISRPRMPESIRRRVMARQSNLAPGASFQMDFDPTGRMLTLMNPDSASVIVCVSDIDQLPQWERAAPLRSAMGWILRRSDRHLLHAAAVTNAHGAALLLGSGGAGKTTTSLRCRQQGMGFIGDDICVIDTNPSPRVFNLYGTAKTVWSDRGLFPELDPYLVTDPGVGDYKAVYALNRSLDHQIPKCANLRALILVDKSRPAGTLEQADPARVVALVASTTASFLPDSGRSMLAALSSLARDLPVVRLSVGEDPVLVSQLVGSVIESADSLSGILNVR